MKRVLFTLSLLISLASLSGCDNFDLFTTEKQVASKIQKSWKVVSYSPDVDKKEVWTFDGSNVTILMNNNVTFTGTYYVEKRWSKFNVCFSKFSYTGYSNSGYTAMDINRRWNISEIDGGVLYLSSKNEQGAIISLEFVSQ